VAVLLQAGCPTNDIKALKNDRVSYYDSTLPRQVAVGKKNDFGLVLQKNCSFWFGFGFTKLTVVSVFSVRFLHCVLFNVYALYASMV